MSPGRRLVVVPALLLLAPILFYYETTLAGRAYLLRDLYNWFYPWRDFAARSLWQGEFPLWNPYAFLGSPFLANLQSGLLYPLNVLFWIFDFPTAMALFLVLQSAMAGWFMYLLARGLGCGVPAGMVAALSWSFSGWMVVHVEFPNKFAAAAWLPLLLHALNHWRGGRRAFAAALGGVAALCCITAGYPLTTLSVMLGAGVVWAALSIQDLIASRRGLPRASLVGGMVSLPLFVTLGAAASAIQILPFLEAVRIAGLTGAGNPLKLGLAPVHFLALVYPHLFGLPGYLRYWGGDLLQFWLGHFYVGLAVLPLAGVALVSRFRRRVGPEAQPGNGGPDREWTIPLGALLLLAVLFCMGSRTPLAPLLINYVPGFGYFKWLTTASLLIVFPLSLLAAFGLERMARSGRGLWALIIPAIPLTAMHLFALAAPEAFLAAVRSTVSGILLPEQADLIAPNIGIVRGDVGLAAALSLLLASVALAVRRAGPPPAGRSTRLLALVPLILFLDLFAAARGTLFAGSRGLYRYTPPLALEIAADPRPESRIYVTEATLKQDLWLYGSEREEDFLWAAKGLLFNHNLPHRVFSASDGDPMASSRWRAFHRMIELTAPEPDRQGRLFALAGVSRVIRGPRGRLDVARIAATLPRVFLARTARRVEPGGALEEMLSPAWDPYAEVLLEEPPPPGAPAGGEAIDRAEPRLTRTNNTVTVEVDSPSAAWLVLAEAWDPGWSVAIDGRAARLFLADHLFRAVPIPAGRHTVRFEYFPRSLAWGVVVSIAGLAGILGAAAAAAAFRARN